jgi:hypothetical protein
MICSNTDKLSNGVDLEATPDGLTYGFSERGACYPGPAFGCFHHQPVRDVSITNQ